jgi:large subunit ribosomal protein L21e
MVNRKKIRTRGKLQLSRYFQELKDGEKVAVVEEPAVQSSFPKRIQGRTGIVQSKRGKAYVIRMNDHDKEKQYIIEPVHLKRIKSSNILRSKK